MPLARIDLPTDEPGDYGRKVADVVYEAMDRHSTHPRIIASR